MKHIYIYALIDPREPEHYRYIGKTQWAIERRLKSHICKAKLHRSPTHCASWILKLLHDGVAPQVIQIQVTDELNWAEAERSAIALHRKQGHRLTNICLGGEGSSMEPETREKLSIALSGRKLSESTKEKLRIMQVGTSHSLEVRMKMSRTRKSKHQSQNIKIIKDPSKVRGESHPQAKLTIEDVIAIRASNETCSMLSARYGITRQYVSQVSRGLKWAHI